MLLSLSLIIIKWVSRDIKLCLQSVLYFNNGAMVNIYHTYGML